MERSGASERVTLFYFPLRSNEAEHTDTFLRLNEAERNGTERSGASGRVTLPFFFVAIEWSGASERVAFFPLHERCEMRFLVHRHFPTSE